MASRGFLIRFIDIGLIVLFGFLMISDIDSSSRVELADTRSEPEESPEEEREQAFVLVEIAADGMYLVSDPRVEGDEVTAEDAAALAQELLRRRGAHRDLEVQTVVLIQPDPSSLVQSTVDAMDVCDRLSLTKSLRMDIEIAGVER
jgi:biopolymer transport protein ExbD